MDGRMLHTRSPLMLFALLTLLAAEAGAQARALAPEELATRSQIIAVGTVTETRSEWNADHTRIQTVVTLAVDQYWKGTDAGATLTLIVPGGEVGETGELYSHTARFTPDETVLIFAGRDEAGHLRVTAGDRGKLVIHNDRTTGEPLVSEGVTLEVLKRRVLTALRAAEGR